MLICTEISGEDYRGRPMWVVTLDNGLTVYQSDENPNLEVKNSWLGLKKYVEENGLYIKDMILRFRDHAEVVGSNADGYFFIHSILGNIVGYCQNFYKAGTLQNNLIVGKEWIIPELMPLEDFTKPVDHFSQQSLIQGKPSAK
jgi:hypothetical protein